MPVITLPDGSQRAFDNPVSVHDVAADIGPGLAKAALGGVVDGREVDTSHTIENDVSLAIITDRDDSGLEIIRHSTAHLLAMATQELFPGVQVTIGPVIEDGFFYDFSYPPGFTMEDLDRIGAEMRRIVKSGFEQQETLPELPEAEGQLQAGGRVGGRGRCRDRDQRRRHPHVRWHRWLPDCSHQR